jgi:hypothetical protein
MMAETARQKSRKCEMRHRIKVAGVFHGSRLAA